MGMKPKFQLTWCLMNSILAPGVGIHIWLTNRPLTTSAIQLDSRVKKTFSGTMRPKYKYPQAMSRFSLNYQITILSSGFL